MLKFILSFFLLLISSCSSIEDPQETANHLALKASAPLLEKVFFAEAPIIPSSRSILPTTNDIPEAPFDPRKYFKNSIQIDKNGNLNLLPGDYVIPVLTYCMKLSGSSPSAHSYRIAKLQGKNADLIATLNKKGLKFLSASELQALSWKIQSGFLFEDLDKKSQEVLIKIYPSAKKILERSFWEKLNENWDILSEKSQGTLPSLEEISENSLSELGEVGQEILDLKKFRKNIQGNSEDNSNLFRMIFLPGKSKNQSQSPWSRISPNVYARFITQGHYLELGEMQIRVLNSLRSPKSDRTTIDLSHYIADPNSNIIQPLTFTPLIGASVVPYLTAEVSPLLALATLSAILYSGTIDWDAFIKASSILQNKNNEEVNQTIKDGQEKHSEKSKKLDAMEESLKDTPILDDVELTTKEKGNGKGDVRDYTKRGGKEQQEKDFDKVPGERKAVQGEPGTDMKTLPDGTKVIKRPEVVKKTSNKEEYTAPTIEIQPPKTRSSNDDLRIKVRYY